MFILTDLTDIHVLESISSRIGTYFGSNFLFVKPLDVPPLDFCFNVQTDMKFW